MMKIAIFSWESLHSISVGGVAVHVTELAAALQRRGHEVHVFTRPGYGYGGWQQIDGVHYHYCPFESHDNFVEEVNNMCRSFVHHFFATENITGRFNIVHAHDWLASNAAVWAKEGRGTKMILTIHATEYGRCGNHLYDGMSNWIRDHESNGTSCTDRVITVSNYIRDEICWLYKVPPWKITVIHNGIHALQNIRLPDQKEIRSKLDIGPKDPMVLFVGRLSIQKGPDILINAIPMILHYYPNAKFVIVGDGDLRGMCETMAGQLGVTYATRFLGYQNGNYLKDLYKTCDVVIVPSRNEPFGIVVLEAWSAGKPVVATRNGGPAEIIQHGVNGFTVYDHPESVAWGIGTLFQDFEKARLMGDNGRTATETEFNWDKIAESTEDVYYA